MQKRLCGAALTVGCLSVFLGTSACRTRGGLAIVATDGGSDAGLDLMDIAILYPPPGGNEIHSWARFLFRERQEGRLSRLKDPEKRDKAILSELSERAFWPQLFTKGKELMPRSVFDQIIEIGGGRPPQVKGAGIDYTIKALSKRQNWLGQNKNVFDVEVDMSEADKWRVSSFRFDPCPYSVYHGLPGKESSLEGASTETDETSGAAETTAPKKDRARLCQPEFRLVVQPFLGRNATETQLGAILPFVGALQSIGGIPTGIALDQVKGKGRGWFAADYAIHLFYRLTQEEAAQMARELLELKQSYGAQCPTTGVPMQVHPCLVSEALNVDKEGNISFARQVFDIYSRYVGGLHKAAIWGSRVNASPWTFFAGEITTGANGDKTFTATRIKPLAPFSFDNQADRLGPKAGVTQSDGSQGVKQSTLPNSSQAKSADEKAEKLAQASLLTQGKAMFFDRNTGFPNTVITNGQRINPNLSTYRKRRLNPPPKEDKDSLAVFVMGQVGFQNQDTYEVIIKENGYRVGLQSVETPGNRTDDLLRVTSRIENPILNNEFRVDCASCHMANMEASNERMLTRSKMRRFTENTPDKGKSLWQIYELAMKGDESTSWDRIHHPKSLYPKEQYWGPGGLSTFRTASSTVSLKGTRSMVYVLNQFSYYAEQPMVSNRVMNEVADSADFANRNLLGKQAPFRGQCDRRALDLCLTGLDGKQLKRGDWTVDMGLEGYHFDWYQAFLSSRQLCLAPERGICTYPE